MMEVFCFLPSVLQTVQGGRKNHSDLIKSLMGLVLACLTPVYCSAPRAEESTVSNIQMV